MGILVEEEVGNPLQVWLLKRVTSRARLWPRGERELSSQTYVADNLTGLDRNIAGSAIDIRRWVTGVAPHRQAPYAAETSSAQPKFVARRGAMPAREYI